MASAPEAPACFLAAASPGRSGSFRVDNHRQDADGTVLLEDVQFVSLRQTEFNNDFFWDRDLRFWWPVTAVIVFVCLHAEKNGYFNGAGFII